MKKHIFKRILAFVLVTAMLLPNMQTITVQADEVQKIAFEKVSAKAASGHGADLIMDANMDTYWQSIPSGGDGNEYYYNLMYSHNRYIDITLDGMYDLSQIKVYNRVDGSYNNYYIYVSTDGINYDKIVSKTSNEAATAQGDSYSVNVAASHIRLNMAYNSSGYVTNLSEIEVYGVRTGDRQDDTTGIQVSNWNGSDWQVEWDRFEADSDYARAKILNEMKNLVGRVIGEEWQDDFVFELRGSLRDEKDIFEVTDGEDGKILIRGNNGIALASGFNYYLKNFVNVDYNPLFGSNVNMKGIVPVGKTIVKEAQYDLRYALNFCTYSYTMAFWNWDEYEEFLDWAAMNGLNLVLDIVGQEEVLRQTFLEYGFTNEEIKDYISGPAYFAWFYMQNLYSVGGPLPDAWFEQRTELGRKIHDRMQTYGITPVLQGFSGQVPETFPKKNQGAQMAPVDSWPGHTRPSLLMTYVSADQTDYFKQVSETFYEKQKNVFGDISDYYATDPFHEGGNVGSLDVATIYQTVQAEMIKSNPDAVWILQQWQDGLSDGVKISRLDTSHVLVLDLQSDMRQQNWPFEQRQIPWLYCMLHNFGGRMGLDGEVPVIATDPMETYNNKNYMVGIGITPEALENGPVAYELFLEVLWSKDPIDYNEWIDGYAKRRAGGDSESLQEAWDILVETAYADKGVYYQGAAETVMNARPGDSFQSASTWGHSGIYYEKTKLDEALLLLAENYEAFSASDAYKYDLADVAEQVICNVAVEYHSRMVAAKNARDLEAFKKYSTKFLELFDLSEQVLSSTDEFMLGTWIEASRKMITNADDWTKDLFEFNARSLVTTWGGERAANTGGLKDYSNRKWAGLTSDFYKERWSIWVRNRLAELEGRSKDTADQKAENNWFMWEYQWTNRKSDDENGKYAFPATPINVDLGTLAQSIYNSYSYSALLREEGAGEEIVNALKGKIPALTGTTAEGDLANIVDGDTGNKWVGTGTGNHVLEFDLEGTYRLDEYQISIPQLAKNFPYYYKIEVWNSDANEWIVVKEYNDRQLGSNTVVRPDDATVATKVRLTMNTSDDTDSPLTITDFVAYGKALNAVTYENLALGVTPSVNVNTHNESNINLLTDGDITSLWKTPWPYNDGYPANAEIDLGRVQYVDNVQVYFETPGRPFQFSVSVVNTDGTIEEIYKELPEEALAKASYTATVQKEVSKVIVSITGSTGKGQYYGSTPAMTEIMVMGLRGKDPINFAEGKVNGLTVEGGNASGEVIDGSKDTWKKVEKDQEIVFTLPDLHYVKTVDITFEKGEKDNPGQALGLKYQLYGESADGQRIMLCDKGSTLELLPQRTITVPVEMAVKKLIFIHRGNNGQGNAYAAETRLYEFEVFGGTPESNAAKATVTSSVTEGTVPELADGSADTTYHVNAGEIITLTLPKAADVQYVSVQKKAEEAEIVYCKMEYYDNNNASWISLGTVSAQSATEEKVFVEVEGNVCTKQVRFLFEKEMELAEIGIYATDYSDFVKQKLQEVRQYIAGLSYGDSNGKYSENAKVTLENTLANIEAQLTDGVSSEKSTQLQQEADAALDKFNKEGKVYLNRDLMLVNLVRAKDIIDELKAVGNDPEELEAFETLFEIALNAYNNYNIGQGELDAQTNTLAENIRLYEEEPGLVDKTALQAKISEAESYKESDYTPESFAVLKEKIAKAKNVIDKENATQRAVNAALAELNAALGNLISKTAIREFSPEILAENAKANSHQLPASGTDGPAAWAFDDDNRWWHSRWGSWDQKEEHEIGQDKGGKPSADNPIWIQTGFDKKWYVSSIEYTGRENRHGLIHEYEISVANLKDPTAMPQDSDFRVVKSGTLDPVNTTQTIALDKIIAATHIRITVTDAYDNRDGGDGDGHLAAKNISIFGCDAIEGIEEDLAGYSLTLEGNIGVNFHMQLGEEVLDKNNNACMIFTLDGKNYKEIPVTDEVMNEKGYYVFKCEVPVKDMNKEITAQISCNGKKGSLYTYTVKAYAESILENSNDYTPNTITLVNAMNVFGNYANAYFTNETLEDVSDMKDVTSETLNDYCGTVSNNSIYKGSSLLLKSKTVLRHYFSEYVDGSVKKGDLYYIEYPDIAAHELGNDIETTVKTSEGDIKITYSPLSYAYNVLSRDDISEKLTDLMRAMYLYHQAAQAYAEKSEN